LKSHFVAKIIAEESPPKVPKATSLSSATLASLGGPTAAAGGKLKPSYYNRKTKHKDEGQVRSPTLKFVEQKPLFVQSNLISFSFSVDQIAPHHLKVT